MNRITLFGLLTLLVVNPFALCGADSPDSLNRLSFGARFGMNLKADFRNSAPANPGPPGVNIGPEAAVADHTYDDGYVLVDSSGNFVGLGLPSATSNWGYQKAGQVVGGAMQFRSAVSSVPAPSAINNVTGDPQYGVELTYQRVIGSIPALSSAQWGLEVALGGTDLDLHDNRTGTRPATVTIDAFQLNGVSPPAGYNGSFAGPGALLGDTPMRAMVADVTTLTTRQKLSGQLYSLRLGPFAEWNLTSRLSLAASVGLTLAPSSVEYDFSETTTLPGGATFGANGHSSKTQLLYGGYVSGTLNYDFGKHWGAYVGAQFQSLTDLEQSVGSHSARLNQGVTAYGTVGLGWRF